MAKKKCSYFGLSAKKLRRSLLRNPLQFLSILIIILLGSSLLNGFYGSALQFEKQVNKGYELSNTADVVTTLDVDKKASDVSAGVEKDYKLILNTVGDKGSVETRNVTSSKLNGSDSYICIYDNYPTISKDYNFVGNEESKNGDFFVVDYRYRASPDIYGKSWIKDDGSYNAVTVSIPITALGEETGEGGLGKDVILALNSSKFLKSGKTNILDKKFLNLSITPTGDMYNADNVSWTQYYCAYSFLSRSLFEKKIEESIKENYNIEGVTPTTEAETKALAVLKDPKTWISKKFYSNNQYLTKLNNANNTKTVKEDINKVFKAKSTDNLLLNIEKSESEASKLVLTDVRQTKILSIAFPCVFLLVAILVTLTTFSQIILKERNEIGTLKAMGVSNKHIKRYYVLLGLIVIFIGCLLGCIIGPLLIPPIMNIKFSYVYLIPARSFVFPTVTVLISTLVFLASTELIINGVVKKETDLPPSFSLRPVLPKSIKSSTKKKKAISIYSYLLSSCKDLNKKQIKENIINGTVKINGVVATGIKDSVSIFTDTVSINDTEVKYKKTNKFLSLNLAVRNIRCAVPKSIMVVIGIAGCSAILGGAFGVDNSLSYGIKNDIRRFLSSDINLNLSYPDQSTVDALKYYRETTKEIDYMIPVSILPTSVRAVAYDATTTFTTSVYTYDPDENTGAGRFIKLDGLVPKQDELIVTRKVADALNLQIGQNIVFRTLGEDYYGKVGGIVDSFYIHGIFASSNKYQTLGNAYTSVYIETSKTNVKNNLEFAKKLLNNVPGVISFMEYEQNFNIVNDSFKTFSYITLLLKIFAIALAMVVLYNFVILNYRQRSRDLATLKVLGYNRYQVGLSMAYEIGILATIGVIIGCALSLPFEIFLLFVNKNDIVQFQYYIAPLTFVYTILITLGTTVLVNLFLMQRNKKLKMSESLKSIE